MIWLLVIPALAAVFVAGAAVRALILAWTRPPLHAADPELLQPSEDDVHTFLEALPPWDTHDQPAPGETIYTDHSVWLPRTPQLLTPPRQPTEAELDEWKARWHAAQGGPVRVLAPDPIVTVPTPDLDADVEEWQHILAERLATDTDVRTLTPPGPADDTFVTALLSLPVDRVHEAFSTGQFPAVVA